MIFLFLPLFLFASFIDFSPCYKKFDFINNSIPISKSISVKIDKNRNCVYYDKFTNLCFFHSKNRKYVKLFSNFEVGSWAALISNKKIYVGNFVNRAFDLKASLLSINKKNFLISDIFCRAQGIGNKDGFIDGELIKHFYKYHYWGDIGIDVDSKLRIVSIDPFYVRDFKIGDKILYINSKKATLKLFRKYVLLAKVGDIVNINGINIRVRKKVFNFTPLNYFGIYVNKDLSLNFSNKIKNRYFIEDGSKLLAINKKRVHSFKEVKRILSTTKSGIISIVYNGLFLDIPFGR